MTTACIVQARLRSTRLPGKVLLPLPTGRTVLEEVLYRCRQIDGVAVVVVAIADDEGSDLLVPYAERAKSFEIPLDRFLADDLPKVAPLEIVRGPEHDVLARYLKAAEAVNAEVILRVTSDCPLIEPEVCAKVLQALPHGRRAFSYACNNMNERTFPHGWDCEAFTIEALRGANDGRIGSVDDSSAREHVTVNMRRLSIVDRQFIFAEQNQSHIRWTLDTIEDYIVICNEFKRRLSERVAA